MDCRSWYDDAEEQNMINKEPLASQQGVQTTSKPDQNYSLLIIFLCRKKARIKPTPIIINMLKK